MAHREKALSLLLKAPSKQFVNELFVEIFKHRATTTVNPLLVSTSAEKLQISQNDASLLIDAVKSLIKEVIYFNSTAEEIANSFNPNFNKQLLGLIAQILTHHLPNWRKEAIDNQISLPRLESIDWRVDIKSASDLIGQMSVPTVLVEMKVRDEDNQKQPVQKVNFELSRESLATVLEGLTKIRDQLTSISR